MILLTPGKRPEAQKDSQMQRLKKKNKRKSRSKQQVFVTIVL